MLLRTEITSIKLENISLSLSIALSIKIYKKRSKLILISLLLKLHNSVKRSKILTNNWAEKRTYSIPSFIPNGKLMSKIGPKSIRTF